MNMIIDRPNEWIGVYLFEHEGKSYGASIVLLKNNEWNFGYDVLLQQIKQKESDSKKALKNCLDDPILQTPINFDITCYDDGTP